MPTWTTIADVDRRSAEEQLCNGEPAVPYLTAFDGEEVLFSASLGPFERFGCAAAIEQLEPLARAAGTDRLVFTSSGRIHHLARDGAATPPADLPAGARVFPAVYLDAHATPVRMWTSVRRYHLRNVPGEPCAVTWGREHVLDDLDPADGATTAVLTRMVLPPQDLVGPAALRELLARAEVAGHTVGAGLALLQRVFADDPDALAMVTRAREAQPR